MKERLTVITLAVTAAVVIAVSALPVGSSAQLLAEHLHRGTNDVSSPSPSRGGTTPHLTGSSHWSHPAEPTPRTATRRPVTDTQQASTLAPVRATSKPGRAQPTAPPKPRRTVTATPSPQRTAGAPPKPHRTATGTPEHKKPPRHQAKPKTGSRGVVYLTFDDGPSQATLPILSILDRTGSTATFFQLGANAHGQRTIQAAIRGQGSNVGNHSYNHPNLTTLSTAALDAQIANGVRARCFRPPYGATNAKVLRAIHAQGARQVLWTVDTQDWTRPGVHTLQRLGSSPAIHNGSIILMHDGGGDRSQTITALPALISNIQSRGYTVRALPYC